MKRLIKAVIGIFVKVFLFALTSAAFFECLFTAVAVVSVLFAASYMGRKVHAMECYHVRPGRFSVSLADDTHLLRYPWIEKSIRADLARMARREGKMSVFDAATLKKTAEHLEKNPWVKEVLEVAPVYPCGLKWRVSYRLPAAAVRAGRGYVLVDRSGVRLPVTLRLRPSPGSGIFVLSGLGVRADLPAVGEPFSEPGVGVGLAVLGHARTVRNMLRRTGDGVQFIDVSNARSDSESKVNFVTKSGALIEWGRPENGKRLSPGTVKEKFSHLRAILARDGRLRRGWRYRLWTPVPAAQPPDGGHE
jgi:hypothetical protein